MKRNVTAAMLLVLCAANIIITPPKSSQNNASEEVELSTMRNQNQDAVSETLLQLCIDGGKLGPVAVYPHAKAFNDFFTRSTRNIKYVLKVLGMTQGGDSTDIIKKFVENVNLKLELNAYYEQLKGDMKVPNDQTDWTNAIKAALPAIPDQQKFFFLNGVAQLLSACTGTTGKKILSDTDLKAASVNLINIKLSDLGDLEKVKSVRALIMEERAQFLERLTATCITEEALHVAIRKESGAEFPLKAPVNPVRLSSLNANEVPASNGSASSPAASSL